MRRRDPIRSRRRVRFSFASNRCSVWGMKLIPLNDKVLILPAPAESKTPGGIIIPGTAEGKPTRGTVVSIGPKVYEKLGLNQSPQYDRQELNPSGMSYLKRNPDDGLIREGTEVMFPTYGGVEVDIGGVKHRLIPAEELLGVIEN